jgi:hypothetical protein
MNQQRQDQHQDERARIRAAMDRLLNDEAMVACRHSDVGEDAAYQIPPTVRK